MATLDLLDQVLKVQEMMIVVPALKNVLIALVAVINHQL
jgi:hypothetical protein